MTSKADLVVASSRYTAELILSQYPAARVVTIPPGVDPERFRPARNASSRARFGLQGSFVIGTLSRLQRFKGHDTVFEAIRRLPEPVRDRVVYLVAGSGPDAGYLHQRVKTLGLQAQVRFVGGVPEEKLPEFYRTLDLFVLCSREEREQRQVEGFGLVFLEAQACGVPVVGTCTGGIPDAVAPGDGGWLIEQDDSESLSHLIFELTQNPGLREQQGRLARRRVEEKCTWDHFSRRLQEELERRGIAP